MEKEVETHGGGSEAVGLIEAVKGAGDDAWMREGLRGMAGGGDAGIRVRVKVHEGEEGGWLG